MEKVKNKNIISVVLLIVMLFLIGGISYAAYTYVNTGGANTINTGQITMSYAEPSNALEIQEALPISDINGKEQTNYFEFTVTTHATTNEDDTSGIIIPYEINIEKLENSYYCTDNINVTEDTCTGEWIQRPELGNDKVKVYLTKVENNEEEELVTKKISELPKSTLNGVASYIYSTSNLHRQAGPNKTTIYRLRIWIDEETNPSLFNGKEEYRLRVNINSNTGPIS